VDVPWVNLVWSLYPHGAHHAQTSRGSFWWKDVFSSVHDYRALPSCAIGNGETVLFWKDSWHVNGLLCDQFPRLFSFSLNEDATVAELAHSPDLSSNFLLPLSVQAFEELHQIQCYLNGLITASNDSRIFP
jgi:hypothetical protein